MQAAMDVTLPFTHQRKQFGTAIAHNQLVQGKLADMYTKLQAARSYTYDTARKVDELGQIRTQDCAGAIMYAAERATECSLDCIQLLGGMGYVEFAVFIVPSSCSEEAAKRFAPQRIRVPSSEIARALKNPVVSVRARRTVADDAW